MATNGKNVEVLVDVSSESEPEEYSNQEVQKRLGKQEEVIQRLNSSKSKPPKMAWAIENQNQCRQPEENSNSHLNTLTEANNATAIIWHEIDLNSDEEVQAHSAPTPVQYRDNTKHQIDSDKRNNVNISNLYKLSFIQAYFKKLYAFGVSPIKVGRKEGKDDGILYFAHKGKFVLVTILALLQVLIWVKAGAVFGENNWSSIFYFVRLGYRINTLLFRGYFVYLVGANGKKIQELLSITNNWHMQHTTNRQSHNLVKIVSIFCVVTVVIGFFAPTFDFGLDYGWNALDLIMTQGTELCVNIMVWDSNNEDELLKIKFQCGQNATMANICIGSTAAAINSAGLLQHIMIKDITIIVAFELHDITKDFTETLKKKESELQNINYYQLVWDQYKLMKTASKVIDESLGTLIQMLHLENLLFGAYFLYYHIILKKIDGYLIVELLTMLKLILFYWIAGKASTVNGKFCSFIRASFPGTRTLFFENSVQVSTSVILDEINTEPIGVGSSMFYIDPAFVWKFASLVGSYFLFFTDARIDSN